MTNEEFDAAVRARFQQDKAEEWEWMEDEEYDVAHGLMNDSGHYKEWKEQHICELYPDHTGMYCAVCGKKINSLQ